MAEELSTALPLTAAERRWALAAAIASVTVFGLSIGEAVPLLSLVLETRGTDAALNGLNAASAFLGVLIGPLLAPRCVRRVGIRNFLLACFVLDIAVVMLLKVFDGVGPWLALRVLLGIIGSSLFTASEAWINLLAGNAVRGRIIGIYAAALSAGFAMGPMLLSFTGIAGWPPFIANNLITAIAALPLLGIGNLARDFGREPGRNPFGVFARAPLIVCAVAIFGLYETALLTLLPIWGVRIGLPDRLAAAAVSAAYFGAIALQFPIGWLSDKLARLTVLRLCGAVGLVGALLLPSAAASRPALFALLFVWGGTAAGIYPVALGMVGDRFHGGDLIAANAGIVIAYGLGGLLGPTLGGAAMDLRNPDGLLGLFIVVFAVLLLATVPGGQAARRQRR